LQRTKKEDPIRKEVYWRLRSTYQDLADKLGKEASKKMEAKNFEEARKLFEQRLDCLVEVARWDLISGSWPLLHDIFLAEVLANIALTYWLEGKIEEARTALSNEPVQLSFLSPLAKALAKTDQEKKECEEFLETPEKVPCIRAVDGFLANISAKGLI